MNRVRFLFGKFECGSGFSRYTVGYCIQRLYKILFNFHQRPRGHELLALTKIVKEKYFISAPPSAEFMSCTTYDADEFVSEYSLESHVSTEDLQVRVTDPGPQYLDECLPGGSNRNPRSRVQHRPALRARPQRQHPRHYRSVLKPSRQTFTFTIDVTMLNFSSAALFVSTTVHSAF